MNLQTAMGIELEKKYFLKLTLLTLLLLTCGFVLLMEVQPIVQLLRWLPVEFDVKNLAMLLLVLGILRFSIFKLNNDIFAFAFQKGSGLEVMLLGAVCPFVVICAVIWMVNSQDSMVLWYTMALYFLIVQVATLLKMSAQSALHELLLSLLVLSGSSWFILQFFSSMILRYEFDEFQILSVRSGLWMAQGLSFFAAVILILGFYKFKTDYTLGLEDLNSMRTSQKIVFKTVQLALIWIAYGLPIFYMAAMLLAFPEWGLLQMIGFLYVLFYLTIMQIFVSRVHKILKQEVVHL